jgi:hypothetical protein
MRRRHFTQTESLEVRLANEVRSFARKLAVRLMV